MKKNKIKYLAVSFIGALLFAGCNPMENAPTNKFTDDSYWTSPEKAQRVVNMGYSQMYNAGRMWADESLSDNLFEGRSNTDQRLIRNGLADPALGLFANEWKDLYGGIKTCHVFLEKNHLVSMDAVQRARMIAEIRYIRAAIYFRLTEFYGDIPFFTEDITLEESKTISRTPRATVIQFIHEELGEILDQLPAKEELKSEERGKITKGAVCVLQARVYLSDSDWSNASKYCDYLINQQSKYGSYSLFQSYPGLFTQENEYNSEIIMDYGYVPNLKTWGEMNDMAPLSSGARLSGRAPTQSLANNYLTMNGKTIDEDGTYDENNPYNNRDPRMTGTIVYDRYNWSQNINDGSTGKYIYIKPKSDPDQGSAIDEYRGGSSNQSVTGYYVRKYFDLKHESGLASAINIITMRYADVLLMYAEAMNEQNKMTQDIWNQTIRLIRVRAGFTKEEALAYPNKSQVEMTQIIRRERRSELALEGLRWFDLKRWKVGTENLNGFVYGAKFQNNNREYIRLDNRRFNESRDYLWAVPQAQIDLNPNLRPNNPGYAN